MLRADIAGTPGVVTTIALEDDKLITGTTQDCAPIAEAAKRLSAQGYEGPSRDMKLAASVPFVLVERYLNDHNITMSELGRSPEHQRRLLNDPALAHFRVWKGKV